MANGYNNNQESDGSTLDNIHLVSCKACDSNQIYSDRYRCLQCVDYDFCGNCFEERRQTKEHISGHAMVHFKLPNELFNQPIRSSRDITLTKIEDLFAGKRHHIECNGCRLSIVGVRLKCDTCHNYNLCLSCMRQRVISKQHQNTHPLIVTSDQNLIKIDINDIRRGDVLGQGAFGQVCKAKWLSKNRQVACKVICVTTQRRHLEESFRKELVAYAELSGAFILKTFGYGDRILDNGVKECYLITEFMHRGSLANVIHHQNEKLSLRRKLSMACHIASGMRKLHAHTMIHRDIRPDNILVSNNYTAKIGDMGIAHIFNPNERHTLIGCLPFMPPEFHRFVLPDTKIKLDGDGQYEQSLDIFTYGLTLNELFTEKMHRFNQATRRIQLIEESPIFFDLIQQCIRDESTRRPSSFNIEHLLHKYRRAADRFIREKSSNYSKQNTRIKDNLFIRFYNEYHQQEKIEPKAVFPPPPKSHVNIDLIRQHFEDMMQQLKSVEEKTEDRPLDRSVMRKLGKYLDDPKPMRHENHQEFIHVVRRRERSRTPIPLSPRLRLLDAENEFEDRMQRARIEAGFGQRSPLFPRMMRPFNFK